jgi:peptidoglycan hydrolase CwlO-like protein
VRPVRPARPVAGRPIVTCLLAAALVPATAHGQDLNREILDSQRRLEQIRNERARLTEEIEGVRVRVRDIASELSNVERRLSATRSVLAEVEFQSDVTSSRVEETARDLLQTRERMSEGRAVLTRRLRDIYKMGPLHTVRVLLGATSFTDLLNRYRYLQRIAMFDRALVDRVIELEHALTVQDQELRVRMTQLGSLREARMGEVARLAQVEAERQAALEEFRSREQTTRTRLQEIEADEGRMTSLIADLERRRIEAERNASSPSGNAIAMGDAGSLDWPIEGRVIYRFGSGGRIVPTGSSFAGTASASLPTRARPFVPSDRDASSWPDPSKDTVPLSW